MMEFAAVALVVGSAIAYAVLRHRAKQDAPEPQAALVPPELVRSIANIKTLLTSDGASKWSPSLADDAHPVTAAVETALQAGDSVTATTLAESAVGSAPQDPRGLTLLGWASVHSGQPSAALAVMHKVHASGNTSPLAYYVRGRARHLVFEHRSGEKGALPSLITAGDLAVLSLSRTKGGAWMVGADEMTLSSEVANAAVREHRAEAAAALSDLVTALELQPYYIDAAYIVARLAIKLGLVADGRAILDAIAGRMVGRPQYEGFSRDLETLAKPDQAIAAALTPPPPEPPPLVGGKRSKSLKVLS